MKIFHIFSGKYYAVTLRKSYILSYSFVVIILTTGKQMLVNNGFPNYLIVQHIRHFLYNVTSRKTVYTDKKNNIKILYKNLMRFKYKQD